MRSAERNFLTWFLLYLTSLKRWFFTRTHTSGMHFESRKDSLVDLLLWKRGALGRPVVHAGLVLLVVVGIASGGVFGGSSIVSGSYPGIPVNPLVSAATQDQIEVQTVAEALSPITVVSEKPRDKVIEHEVKGGETISKIAEEYGVSVETIKWENSIVSDSSIKPGDKLRILPVSGVAHKVVKGDTIYSVAKKYKAESQAILDFPFNNVGDDLSLNIGDTLIVPDGSPVEAPKSRPTQYIAGNVNPGNIPSISGSSQFIWPTVAPLSQYFSWYHPGIDIPNNSAPPIYASDGGKVIAAGWDSTGYGNKVMIDHGNGYVTLYGHLSQNFMSVGQTIGKGQPIGVMGSTGRSTGTHLHFEIRYNGVSQNPLSFLK